MTSKLKVLQVIPKLGYGGAETGCYDLAHYLSENNCSSYIVTSGGELTKYINKKKVKLIRLPVHSKNPILMFLNSLILIVIIIIGFFTFKSKKKEKLFFTFILGGAIGNVYDRITYKAVPDFIDLHIGNFHWFSFNIADIFITLGIIFMILTEFTVKEKK